MSSTRPTRSFGPKWTTERRWWASRFARWFADAGEDPGILLSGGQWQRLALARSFMRDRRDLLILDEPNSGLDAAAEHDIHQRLRRHRAGATSVLISHRLSTIRHADHIVALSGGQTTERGTHQELLASDGEYAKLFQLQAAGYSSSPDDQPLPASPEVLGTS